jgi:hypothetical protein
MKPRKREKIEGLLVLARKYLDQSKNAPDGEGRLFIALAASCAREAAKLLQP